MPEACRLQPALLQHLSRSSETPAAVRRAQAWLIEQPSEAKPNMATRAAGRSPEQFPAGPQPHGAAALPISLYGPLFPRSPVHADRSWYSAAPLSSGSTACVSHCGRTPLKGPFHGGEGFQNVPQTRGGGEERRGAHRRDGRDATSLGPDPRGGSPAGPAPPSRGPRRTGRSRSSAAAPRTSTGNRTRPTVNTARPAPRPPPPRSPAHVTRPAPAGPASAARSLEAAALLTIYGQVLPHIGRRLGVSTRHSSSRRRPPPLCKQSGACREMEFPRRTRAWAEPWAGTPSPSTPRAAAPPAPPRAAAGGAGRAP